MNGILLLLALVSRPDSVRVRSAERDTTLTVVATSSGPALRADVVLPLLGAVARVTGFGRWTIQAGDIKIGLADGVPFAICNGVAIPLAAAPSQQNDAFLLPLQILSDLIPRLGHSITWDAGRRELRVVRVAAAQSVTTAHSPAPIRAAAARHWTVVVDAGHGGPDAGMHGPIGGRYTIYEKDITLAVAKRLSRDLRARGVEVVMTRVTDTLIALGDRGRMANQRQGNLFISIHVNAANPNWKEPGAARGFETYFLAEARTEDDRRVARMENEAVQFEGTHGRLRDDALGFILSDMKQNEHLRESNDLAESVQARLAKIHPGPSRGVKQAGFVVLVTSFMPSVLVEIGFGTNLAEAAWISGDEGQRAISGAVADAAMDYLASYERRVGGNAGAAGVSPEARR